MLTEWQRSWVRTEPTNETTLAILNALTKYKARVTGSWARGDMTEDSDFDFYIRESDWRDFVKDAPKGWESCIVGHIAWQQPDIGLIEASCIFKNQRKERQVETVELFNRVWRTW